MTGCSLFVAKNDNVKFDVDKLSKRMNFPLPKRRIKDPFFVIATFYTEPILNSDKLKDHQSYIVNYLQNETELLKALIEKENYNIKLEFYLSNTKGMCSIGIEKKLLKLIEDIGIGLNITAAFKEIV